MKKAIIIIILLLVILTGVGVILWFLTPIFDFLKPARDNFAIQAKKLFGAKTEVSYDDYLKSIEPLKGETLKSYVMKANVSANVSLPSNVIDYTTQRRINNTTIKYEKSYDADSKASALGFDMEYSGKDVIDFNLVKNGNKITIESKDLYDKAITMDMSKFRTFCKNNNINITDEELTQIENMTNSNSTDDAYKMMYDLLYLTEDEYKSLQKNYGDILKKYIGKENYTTKKNQKISVNGEDVKATGYSLTISGKDVYNIIKSIAEDAKDDDNVKSIVANKLNIIKKYVGNVAGIGADEDFLSNEYSQSDVEKYIQKFITEFESSEESFSNLNRSVKITIYANKKSNPVKLEVAVVKNKNDDGKVIFSGEYGEKKNTYTLDVQNIMKVVADITESDYSDESVSVDKVVIVDKIHKKSDTARKGTLSVSVQASGAKMEVAQIEYDFVTSKSEIKRNFSVSLSDNVASLVGSNVKLDVVAEMTGLDSDESSMKFDIDAALGSYKVKVTADGTLEYGKSNIPTYNESNSIDIFNKSEEEVMNIVKDVITKASDVLPTRLAYYGINITKQEILDIIPSSSTTVEPTTDTTIVEQPAA